MGNGSNGIGKDTVISYTYDGLGNRISKSVKITENSNTTSEDFTYYIRDVQGNILSTYSKTGASLVLDEQMLYGSDLLGVWKPENNSQSLPPTSYAYFYNRKIGNKQYSIKDHLGNVRVTFADVKIPANGLLQDFVLETQSVSTYYPFGWEIEPLSWAFESFKFGFNGQEKSSEISNGNYTAKFWEYDSRIGKRWNIDPKPNTSSSPYLTFANNPVWFSDALGDTIIINLLDGTGNIVSFLTTGKKISPSNIIASYLEHKQEFDGVFILDAHGSNKHIGDNRQNHVDLNTPQKIMDVLNENEYWKIANELAKKGEMQLTLIISSCNSATPINDETPIAQEFSEQYDYLDVVAANGYVTNRVEDRKISESGNYIFNASFSVKHSGNKNIKGDALGYYLFKGGENKGKFKTEFKFSETINPNLHRVGKKAKNKKIGTDTYDDIFE